MTAAVKVIPLSCVRTVDLEGFRYTVELRVDVTVDAGGPHRVLREVEASVLVYADEDEGGLPVVVPPDLDLDDVVFSAWARAEVHRRVLRVALDAVEAHDRGRMRELAQRVVARARAEAEAVPIEVEIEVAGPVRSGRLS